MIKEDDTNENNPCPCYNKTCTDCPKGFEKIVDFKNAGLVIYRHSVKPEQVNQIIGIGGSVIDESGFIFHNTKDEDIVSKDFLPQIEQWAVKCVRCRQIMKHAIKILQKVSAISKNEIVGICEHCRLKEQPCGECEGALKTFLETKKEAEEIGFTKERSKEWLKNVQNELKHYFENEKETGKERLKDYIEKFKDTGKLKLRASSEVRFDQLCRMGHDRSERKLDIRELCRQSGRDLRKPSPFITVKSQIQIPFNFDELETVDSTLIVSLDRKTKLAVLKIEKPSTWNKHQIKVLPKKDKDSKNDNRFIEGKHPRSHVNEEIRQKQEAIRLKKLEEEEERKQRSRQKKIKLTDEKQKLEEEKQRLDKEQLAGIKERKHLKDSGLYTKSKGNGFLKDTASKMQSFTEVSQKRLDLKSKSQLSKSELKKSKMKESKGKLKSSSDKSLNDKKSGSASSKIEQKKSKSELEGESKQKTELKYSKSEPQAGLKQSKMKDESKQRDTESKSASKEAQSKEPKVESRDTKTEQMDSKAISKHPEARYKKESKDSIIKPGSKSAADLKEIKDASEAKKSASADKPSKEKGKMDSDKAKPEKDLSTTQKKKKSTNKDEESVIKYGKARKIKSPEEPRVSLREVEAQLKAVQEEKASKARQEVKATRIEMLKDSQDLMILGLVKVKYNEKRTLSQIMSPSKMQLHLRKHIFIKGHLCLLCMNSVLDLEYVCRMKHKIVSQEMITGCKIIHTHSYNEENEDSGVKPILFQYKCDDDMQSPTVKPVARKYVEAMKPTKTLPNEEAKGVIRYALSDRTFIEKGWTILPTEKIVRKMNVYRMRPAHPEFDWFARNRNKQLMTYDSGERFAEFDDDGHGRWFYRNQRLALQYYDAEELNAQQRYVIYSNGEPDERGRTRPYTVLAMFDFLGNGVVFDHGGKIRMKYNQTEGVVLDKSIGPVSHWQWHTLNDPPVLQQVMIDTHMTHKDPDIIELTTSVEDKQLKTENEDMLAIEFDKFVKEKIKKLTQKFKPFQIRMKALKINEHFSLKVLDQANVYLIYRDGTTNIKLNLGMLLDHKEIVDTDTAELGEVASNMERLPARTDSLAAMQRSVAYAQHFEKTRTKRELILRPPEPSASVDQLAAAASPPMRLPLRPAHLSTTTITSCYKSMKPSSNNIYYDNRLC